MIALFTHHKTFWVPNFREALTILVEKNHIFILKNHLYIGAGQSDFPGKLK